jgi:cathepsin L
MNLQEVDGSYTKYLAKHGKSYRSKAEYSLRKAIYEASLEQINRHNSKNHSWFKAVNQFSDMTSHEIEQMLGGGIEGEEMPEIEVINQETPSKAGSPVDWRGKMNAVKNQGQCGSCWSFAATATIEGRYAIKKGSKVVLSEQQMVDCATACNGCNGGWASRALQYVQSAGGQMSSASYPYRGAQGGCRFSSGSVQARVSGVSGVSNAKSALASGPVAIYLQATSQL